MNRLNGWILALILFSPAWLFADELPVGPGEFRMKLADKDVTVFTYRPKGYDPATGKLLIVFHGTLRNADTYRDSAIPIADRQQVLVAAPRFTREEFPSSAYQRGNLLERNGEAKRKEDWTWQLVTPIVEELRKRAGRDDQPFSLIGHSAGGQFLIRLSAFTDIPAERIVVANAGSQLFPSLELPYPYGFGGLPEELRSEEVLKRYLERPITFYQGTADTVQDQYFDKSGTAMKQGESRLQRGHNVFQAGQKLAEEKGWEFRWKLVEAPDVAHSAKAMFALPVCDKALYDKPQN